MHGSSAFWSCSALALLLSGCSGGQAAGGFTPQAMLGVRNVPAETNDSGTLVQPDFAAGIAEFGANGGVEYGIASDGIGHEYIGAAHPYPALLWFDESTHAIHRFRLPKPAKGTFALALQGSIRMWFTDKLIAHDGAIGYMRLVNHTFQEYTVPTHNPYLHGIAAGLNHTMWFTEWLTCKVGRIDTTSGQISEYTVPSPCNPGGITLGPDGAMWFVSGFSICRITDSGQLSEYSVGQNGPADVTTGPDGAIWFSGLSDQYGALIGRIDVYTHVIKIAKYGAGGGGTLHIVTRGSDLWMTATDANKIDRYDPGTHIVYRRSLPQGYTSPNAITLGADNQLWFTNHGPQGTAIGKLCPEMNSQQCKISP